MKNRNNYTLFTSWNWNKAPKCLSGKTVKEWRASSSWTFTLSAGLPEAMPEKKGHVQWWATEGDLWEHWRHLQVSDGLCKRPGETVQQWWPPSQRDRTLLPGARKHLPLWGRFWETFGIHARSLWAIWFCSAALSHSSGWIPLWPWCSPPCYSMRTWKDMMTWPRTVFLYCSPLFFSSSR